MTNKKVENYSFRLYVGIPKKLMPQIDKAKLIDNQKTNSGYIADLVKKDLEKKGLLS